MSALRVHVLKCWPESFRAQAAGLKPYEVRRDDRGFMVGDVLVLREWEPHRPPYGCEGSGPLYDGWRESSQHGNGEETGKVLYRRVTYKTPGGSWGLPADVCVLGLVECPEPKEA